MASPGRHDARVEYGNGTDTVRLVADGRRGVDCLMALYEPLCYDLLCEQLPDGARAADVGCYKGGSACILARGMARRGKKCVIACHDLFQPYQPFDSGPLIDIEAEFDANTASWVTGPGVTVVKIKGDSKRTHAVHPDASLDYCFIDGDHSYEGALADMRAFWPKLKSEGWMVIQDCNDEVARALDTAVQELRIDDMPCLYLRPPQGQDVVVFTRQKQALDTLSSNLLRATQAVQLYDAGAGTCAYTLDAPE